MSVIKTKRLILRNFQQNDFEDVEQLYETKMTKSIKKSFPDVYRDVMSQMFNEWLDEYERGLDIRWAITLRDNGKLIGDILVNKTNIEEASAEIGYNILKEHWNNGYATEAARAIIQNLFERGYERVFAYHEPSNPASGRVMEKCGMKYTGTERKILYHDMYFEICKYEIKNSQKPLDKPGRV